MSEQKVTKRWDVLFDKLGNFLDVQERSDGDYVLYSDHEAALAAERKTINDALEASNEAGFAFMSPAEVIRHQAQESATKDARIAELEREQENGFAMLEMNGVPRQRAKRVSNGIDVLATRCGKLGRIHDMTVQDLNALRAAIEAKAREWVQRIELVPVHAKNDLTLGRAQGIRNERERCAAELRALLEVKP